jgi:two-component system sensor histidine kinase KdpD
MEQVLVNLLENAARHTPEGTHVWIAASNHPDRVEVVISNDGPCLEVAELETIFEKFGRGSSAGEHGSGLGLAICRAIVEAHGGRISARKREPAGVAFVLGLPKREIPPEVPIA